MPHETQSLNTLSLIEAGCLVTCAPLLPFSPPRGRMHKGSPCFGVAGFWGRRHLIGPPHSPVIDTYRRGGAPCRNDTGGEGGRGRDASRLWSGHGSILHHLNSIYWADMRPANLPSRRGVRQLWLFGLELEIHKVVKLAPIEARCATTAVFKMWRRKARGGLGGHGHIGGGALLAIQIGNAAKAWVDKTRLP
jgi:hypothetical protein